MSPTCIKRVYSTSTIPQPTCQLPSPWMIGSVHATTTPRGGRMSDNRQHHLPSLHPLLLPLHPFQTSLTQKTTIKKLNSSQNYPHIIPTCTEPTISPTPKNLYLLALHKNATKRHNPTWSESLSQLSSSSSSSSPPSDSSPSSRQSDSSAVMDWLMCWLRSVCRLDGSFDSDGVAWSVQTAGTREATPSHPFNHPFNHLINPSINHLTNLLFNQPYDQPFKQSSNQPSNHPSNHPLNQPSNQPSNQPFNQPSNQPSNQPFNQPSITSTNESSTRPVIRSLNSVIRQSANRPHYELMKWLRTPSTTQLNNLIFFDLLMQQLRTTPFV